MRQEYHHMTRYEWLLANETPRLLADAAKQASVHNTLVPHKTWTRLRSTTASGVDSAARSSTSGTPLTSQTQAGKDNAQLAIEANKSAHIGLPHDGVLPYAQEEIPHSPPVGGAASATGTGAWQRVYHSIANDLGLAS
jgi:hypothetical protein